MNIYLSESEHARLAEDLRRALETGYIEPEMRVPLYCCRFVRKMPVPTPAIPEIPEATR